MSYSVYRRNNVILAILITDEDSAAVDITGAEIRFLVSNLIDKTTSDGIEVIDAATGSIEVSLTSTDTDLAPGQYLCELLVIDADGNRWTGLIAYLKVVKNLSYLSVE